MPDFSTHLRTVHFTLILACVITFVSIIGGAGTEVDRAHQQLLQVIKIRSEWERWLSRWALEEAKGLETAGVNQWTNVPSSLSICIPGTRNWEFQLRGSPLQFLLLVQKKAQRVFANAVRKVN